MKHSGRFSTACSYTQDLTLIISIAVAHVSSPVHFICSCLQSYLLSTCFISQLCVQGYKTTFPVHFPTHSLRPTTKLKPQKETYLQTEEQGFLFTVKLLKEMLVCYLWSKTHTQPHISVMASNKRAQQLDSITREEHSPWCYSRKRAGGLLMPTRSSGGDAAGWAVASKTSKILGKLAQWWGETFKKDGDEHWERLIWKQGINLKNRKMKNPRM